MLCPIYYLVRNNGALNLKSTRKFSGAAALWLSPASKAILLPAQTHLLDLRPVCKPFNLLRIFRLISDYHFIMNVQQGGPQGGGGGHGFCFDW